MLFLFLSLSLFLLFCLSFYVETTRPLIEMMFCYLPKRFGFYQARLFGSSEVKALIQYLGIGDKYDS